MEFQPVIWPDFTAGDTIYTAYTLCTAVRIFERGGGAQPPQINAVCRCGPMSASLCDVFNVLLYIMLPITVWASRPAGTIYYTIRCRPRGENLLPE